MKSFYVLFPVMLIFSQMSFSETLCLKDEVDYFSCQVAGSKKIISVCSNFGANEEIDDDSWLQYRFGKKGAIELVYPTEKKDSIAKFEGNFFGKYAASSLRFISGKVLYDVHIQAASSGGDDEKDIPASGGVGVEFGGGKRSSIECGKIDIDTYFQPFMDLNSSLGHGETSFTDRFYNSVSKQHVDKPSSK